MSKYDYEKRLKSLFKCERKLERAEKLIAQKVYKNNALWTQLHNIVLRYEAEEESLEKQIELLERRCKEIGQMQAAEEERRETELLNIQELQERQAQQTAKRKQHLEEMDKLHCFEHASKVYVKFKQLPARIQGITLCEKDDETKLQTFDIDPLQNTQLQMQHLITQNAEQEDSGYQQQWHELFFPK